MTLYLGNNLISGVATTVTNSDRIGQVITSTLPLTDAGLHLLDGALIDGSGIYSAFVDYIADLYDSGSYPDLFETEANWQTSVSTYGVCGKFVYDDVNNTVRLPKITGIIEGTTDVTALLDLVQAGLPSISHTHTTADVYVDAATSKVFQSGTNRNGYYGMSYVTASRTTSTNSAVNSIYGNSLTVQPQTIKVLYYIVIANSTKTDIEVDIDEIATDLNGKADIDLTNITDTAKVSLGGISLPSTTRVSLTAAFGTYTAPANGWVLVNGTATANTSYIGASNTSLGFYMQTWITANQNSSPAFIPVNKGNSYTVYGYQNTCSYHYFFYTNGNESEGS